MPQIVSPIPQFLKDPAGVLDFEYDWTGWLASDEAIQTFDVQADTGITKGSTTQSGGKVVCWFSGGESGKYYYAACTIVTTQGRTDVRRIQIAVINR